MLGVKLGGGAPAKPGAIVVRQRGTRVHPGPGIGMVRECCLCPVELERERSTERERERESRSPRETTENLTKENNLEKKNLKKNLKKKKLKIRKQGRDHTLFALVAGRVSFEWDHRARRRSVRIVEEGGG